MRTDYSIITEETKPCPFCGSKDIRYSIKTANSKRDYYGQCYCNECKAAGPRIRFSVDKSASWIRYTAEDCEYAKNDAIWAWNNGLKKENK